MYLINEVNQAKNLKDRLNELQVFYSYYYYFFLNWKF